jgi:short-subunit dehydrogenase
MGKTSQLHEGKTALITGAAGGIGYKLTELFAKDRYHLVLVDRNRDRLPQVAEDLQMRYGISVRAYPKDLSIPTAPKEIFAELQQESVHIDVLVNNAGFDAYGSFHEIGLDVQLGMIQVNVACLTHLTRKGGRQDLEFVISGGIHAPSSPGSLRRQQGLRSVLLRGSA